MAFGFLPIPCKKSLQPSEIYPGKMFTPVRFRLPFPTDREAPQATRCDNPKKCSSGQPLALGRYPAKSLASVRKCTPKRRSGQTTSGCLFPPITRLPKRPVAITRKSTAPDSLRLLVNPFRKISPATRCDNPKKYSSRQLSAFGQFSAKSLASLRNCALKRRSGQTASSFGKILCEKPLQPLEMYPEKIFPPDSFRLLVNSFRKISPATRCDNPKKYSSRQPSTLDLY